MNKPKILIYDVESLPNKAFMFSLWEPIKPNMLIEEKAIITIAYKWLGNKKTHVLKSKKPYDDKEILIKFCKILEQADYTVAHYGDRFDNKFIRSRILYHRLPPISPLISLDTYKLAKKYFNFNANRLDYLGDYLGVGRKLKTSFSLWKDCAAGKRSAIKQMAEYNKQDVDLLEAVFLAMLPYVESRLNHNLFGDTDEARCDHCGSLNIQKRGFSLTKLFKRQRYNCNDCGSWFSRRVKKGE